MGAGTRPDRRPAGEIGAVFPFPVMRYVDLEPLIYANFR